MPETTPTPTAPEGASPADTLAACPFCASADVEVRRDLFGGTYGVACMDCGANGPDAPTEAEAVTAWNRAAPAGAPGVLDPDALDAAAARLAELLDRDSVWPSDAEARRRTFAGYSNQEWYRDRVREIVRLASPAPPQGDALTEQKQAASDGSHLRAQLNAVVAEYEGVRAHLLVLMSEMRIFRSPWDQIPLRAVEYIRALRAQAPIGDALTPEQRVRLEEIAAREQAATAGPWELILKAGPGRFGLAVRVARGMGHLIASFYGGTWGREERRANAAFVAHARQDIPWLLHMVQELAGAPTPGHPTSTEEVPHG